MLSSMRPYTKNENKIADPKTNDYEEEYEIDGEIDDYSF